MPITNGLTRMWETFCALDARWSAVEVAVWFGLMNRFFHSLEGPA